ncbi:MAG: insulinase family protein [Deltaproteobacteria bacterium]|nr:insulinase family protein [Deltaproteobacteria bacterium]
MARRDHSVTSLKLAAFSAQKKYLANGMPVVICPRPGLSWAYVALYFGVGSRYETAKNNGITHMLEHMLFRGTRKYLNTTMLNAAAEDFGGYLEGATYRDHLVFSTGCHPSAVVKAIAILGEIVQTPRYCDMHIEKEILKEELLETLDQNKRMIDLDNLTHSVVFKNHGLGLPIEGTLNNLARFNRRHLEAHRRRYLVANNAVLSIAGPVDIKQIMRAARRAFTSLPVGKLYLSKDQALPPKHTSIHCVKNISSQVDIRLSFWAVTVNDPDYPALVLLARLLADGLSSRMHAELVDRQGLAYALNAGLNTYSDCGLFELEVSVAPDRVALAINKLLAFVASAKHMQFTASEINRSLRRYRYGMEFMTDDAADLTAWYGRAVLFNIEAEAANLYQRLQKLSQADLHKVAAKFFTPERLNVTMVGNLTKREEEKIRTVIKRWKK